MLSTRVIVICGRHNTPSADVVTAKPSHSGHPTHLEVCGCGLRHVRRSERAIAYKGLNRVGQHCNHTAGPAFSNGRDLWVEQPKLYRVLSQTRMSPWVWGQRGQLQQKLTCQPALWTCLTNEVDTGDMSCSSTACSDTVGGADQSTSGGVNDGGCSTIHRSRMSARREADTDLGSTTWPLSTLKHLRRAIHTQAMTTSATNATVMNAAVAPFTAPNAAVPPAASTNTYVRDDVAVTPAAANKRDTQLRPAKPTEANARRLAITWHRRTRVTVRGIPTWLACAL